MSSSKPVEYHYMIDLETLGVTPGSVITSIGIVQFDINTGKTIREFYRNIDIQSSIDLGFTISGETLKWWLSQPNKADMFVNTKSLERVLEDVESFFHTVNGSEFVTKANNSISIGYNSETRRSEKRKTIVWGNGSSFDLGILGFAYHKCGMEMPWHFYNERDVRTIVALMPEVKKNMVNSGQAHNALDDCKFQIGYLSEIYKKININ
jgi:exodeoxyribonuclease VIII